MTPPTQPPPNHDRGLEYDLATLHRRRFLGLFTAAGLAAVAGCSADEPTAGTQTSASTNTSTSTSTSAATDVDEIPQETGGPYPGDGSNGPNVLTQSGIVRSDITKSFGSASGVATGVPLSVELTVVDADQDKALEGAAVYLWHCDAQGRYSLYSDGVTEENYLRGVQSADGSGKVTFTTIFPAAYMGRWPHIHFEVFESMSNATAAGQVLAVSQIALTQAACEDVYATAGYESSARNFPRTTLQSDNVFGDDGGIYQLAAMSGSAAAGFTAGLNVTI